MSVGHCFPKMTNNGSNVIDAIKEPFACAIF